jgi:hypothetical protein
MSDCLQTHDIIQLIADHVVDAKLASVCRTWRKLLWGQCLQLHRIGNGQPMAPLLRHILCVTPMAQHICLHFGVPMFGHHNDAETCILSTLSHTMLEERFKLGLLSLQISLLSTHNVVPSTVWQPIMRIIGYTNNKLHKLVLDDGGRNMCNVWSMWASAIIQRIHIEHLCILGVIANAHELSMDDRSSLTKMACVALFHGVRVLTLRLPTTIAFQWVEGVFQKQAKYGSFSSTICELNVDVSEGRSTMRPSIAEQIINMVFQICPSLRRMDVCARDNHQEERPMDQPHCIIDKSFIHRLIYLRSVHIDISFTNACSRRFASLLQTLLSLPALMDCKMVATNNNIADDGLIMPMGDTCECFQTLHRCWIDIRDNRVSEMHAAQWCEALLLALNGGGVYDIQVLTLSSASARLSAVTSNYLLSMFEDEDEVMWC